MDKFEYLTCRYNCGDIYLKSYDNGTKTFLEYTTEEINKLGNKGWELVSTSPYNEQKGTNNFAVTDALIAFFKRKKV